MQEQPDNNTESTFGKGMLFLGIFMLLGLILVWFFDGKLKKFYNPNTTVTSTSNQNYKQVILLRNRYNHYVTSGKINGVDVELFLDTGASSVSIPEKIANTLGLQKGQAYPVSTANSVITVHATILNSVEIGEIRLNNIEASINPHAENDILLGMSFLKHLDFAQQNNQLILRQNID